MFSSAFSQSKPAGISMVSNSNNNKSQSGHSSNSKGGFLLNLSDDDSISSSPSKKSQSNIEKLKSLFDIDDDDDDNSDNNGKVIKYSTNLSNSVISQNMNQKSYNEKHDKSKSIDLLSNYSIHENNANEFQSYLPGKSSTHPLTQGDFHLNSKLSQYNQFNTNSQQTPQENQIEYLKKQMELQQKQIQYLLSQQKLSSVQPFEPAKLNDKIELNKNDSVSHAENDQKMQIQPQIPKFKINSNTYLNKTEFKNPTPAKIATFDFSRGDVPSFSVKFNFGTGKQFISKTKPSKPFLMYNFNNFNFSKSKSDNVNKKGGNDYTDSFLLKPLHDNGKGNQNEKNILQISDSKLYILNSDNRRKKYFTYLGPGRASISVINGVHRIIVRHNCTERCILNTRIFPNITPILREKYIQIIGQNFGLNNDDNDDDNDDEENENNDVNNTNNTSVCKEFDDNKNENEKEDVLSIYRISFPTVEKAKEFFQCVSLIK